MYIQITDHCNMTCAHCAFSCGPRKKRFMTMQDFRRAVDLDRDVVSIGGGEPTLHPLFWEMIGYALGHAGDVWLATNGSQTDTALTLAGMAKKGVIGCDLSLDFYHDAISEKVIYAFKRGKRDYGLPEDRRGVRNVSNSVKKAGRAVKTGVYIEEGCCCEGMMTDPDGTLFSCGCRKLVVGDVRSGFNDAGRFLYEHEYRSEVLDDKKITRRNGTYIDKDDIYGDGITDCLFTNRPGADNRELARYLMREQRGKR